jgi:hypothetical protein
LSDVKKVKKIQVPYDLLENREIPHHAVYLYIILKMVCKDNHVKIYGANLRSEKYLNWKTTKTLKKYLQILKEKKYLTCDFEVLPKRNPIELDIPKLNKDQYYVQVDVEAIYKVKEVAQSVHIKKKRNDVVEVITEDCKEMAVRLYYFYTKMFNAEIGKAFPSYEDIKKKLGINGTYIKAINNLLKENNLLRISEGKWYEQEDEDGFTIRRRERNSYKPLI